MSAPTEEEGEFLVIHHHASRIFYPAGSYPPHAIIMYKEVVLIRHCITLDRMLPSSLLLT